MAAPTPADETNPLALLDEAKQLRADNASLRQCNDTLIACLIECTAALIRETRRS